MENPPIKVDGFPSHGCFSLIVVFLNYLKGIGPAKSGGVRKWRQESGPFTHSNSGYLVDQPPASKPPQE